MLKGVDVTVSPGEHVVVFGRSGSGKSTLLRTINLLEQPSAGSVVVFGSEYGPGLPETQGSPRGGKVDLRRQVGMVFQQFNLFPHLTALDNVAIALRRVKRNVEGRRSRARCPTAAASSGCSTMSGSIRANSRVASSSESRSPAPSSMDPKVMLFDEPTSALDPELVGEVLQHDAASSPRPG